ncbi:MAG: ArsA-related P-loop ATPase [Polyangia bacterium]
MEPNQQLLSDLVQTCRVIVCCGAGGVGKTTTAAALSIAAARRGRKVLVLTIDPSRRLAETLGVSRNPPEPVPLSDSWQYAAGIKPPGSLHAWMLDPKLVADESVRRFAGDPESARGILKNRIYQQATTMVAGLHEYTAMKALHRFIIEGAYDLVVLDTPPSRNALDFLDAPNRLAGFLDGAIFRMFVPTSTGFISRAATGLISRIVSAVFGQEFTDELAAFLQTFSQLFASLNTDLLDVRTRLSQPDAAFLLVTSPSEASVVEAHFFHERIVQLRLPFRGFILNRSHARPSDQVFPSAELLKDDATPALRSGIEKLKWLARKESLQGHRDRGLLADLALRAGTNSFAIALPSFRTGANDLSTLIEIAKLVVTERRSGPR